MISFDCLHYSWCHVIVKVFCNMIILMPLGSHIFAVAILPWPVRSPDLSLIEHIRDTVGHKTRLPQISQIWNNNCGMSGRMTQGETMNLHQSLPRSIQACIACRAGFSIIDLNIQGANTNHLWFLRPRMCNDCITGG